MLRNALRVNQRKRDLCSMKKHHIVEQLETEKVQPLPFLLKQALWNIYYDQETIDGTHTFQLTQKKRIVQIHYCQTLDQQIVQEMDYFWENPMDLVLPPDKVVIRHQLNRATMTLFNS